MPVRVVTEAQNLPDPSLAHVAVLVGAAFPPGALLAAGGLVQTGLHQGAATHAGRPAIRRHVDDHLDLQVIEQPSVARTVVALGEIVPEAFDIEPADSRLPPVDPAEKPDLALVGKQVDDLGVLRLVDEIAIRILQSADRVDVLLDAELALELVDSPAQGCDLRLIGHDVRSSCVSG